MMSLLISYQIRKLFLHFYQYLFHNFNLMFVEVFFLTINMIFIHPILSLAVPATSRILMADTYFVQFFMGMPKIQLFSRLDTPNRHPSSAQLACSVLMSNQAGQSLCVDWVCPILTTIIFLESS